MNKWGATGNEMQPTRQGDGLISWMGTMVRYVRSGQPDLTNRQMAMMMLIYADPDPSTVRGLAHKLSVAKPVVTRALNRLGQLGFVRRERDMSDRRNVFIRRTGKGAEFLDLFDRFIAGSADESGTESQRGKRTA